jgi:hypothetical protein
MNIEPIAYINVEERKLEWAEPIVWHTPTIAKMDKVPLYLVKEQNIDYKKKWLQAKKQSDIYERWWIQYRDMAVKLDKELTEAGHMIGVLKEYISDLENGLDSSIKLNKAQAERAQEK